MIIKNKRVLVTGGSGMIGRHLVDLLKKEDCKITIADLSEPTGIDDVEYKKVDLTDCRYGSSSHSSSRRQTRSPSPEPATPVPSPQS